MNEFVNVINTVGFPIFVALGSLYYFTKQNDRILIDSKEREQKLQESAKEYNSQFFEHLRRHEIVLEKFNNTLITIDKRLENLENKKGGLNNE